MSSKDSYHVLLSCASRSDADYFSNLLRAHADGAAIRTREVGTLPELRERLADPTWEVLVATDGEAELSAANVLTAAGEAGMPVLFCTTRLDAAQVDALLADGAAAVLRRDQGKRLFHTVQREVSALRDRRTLESLRPRHQELERRCELLLETSSEALAYATDGLHLHCNHAYARLFGFNDPVELQSVMQLDLVAPEHQPRFRQLLHNYRNESLDSTATALELKRNDGSRFSARLRISRTSYEDEPCMQVQVFVDSPASAGPVAAPEPVATGFDVGVAAAPGSRMAADRPEVVRVEGAWKEYVLGSQVVVALRDVAVRIGQGEFMALAGPSGSGKSTLLNLIGCIDSPTRGSVHIGGAEVSDRTPDELADLRARTIGFIFQTFNLLPVLSAWENVEYPLLQNRSLGRSERRERVAHYLALVGLERCMHHRPNELSGGQRQRVAIARALAARPSIVLADEPTANLDHKTGEGILNLMKSINQQEGATFIFSTHDSKVMGMADRVIVLSDGEVVGERHRI